MIQARQILGLLLLVFPITSSLYANPLKLESKHLIVPRRGQDFLTVVNASNDVAYFRVSISRVVIDENGHVNYVKSNDPRELGLLVVPVNLKMQPQQRRKIRIVSLVDKMPIVSAPDSHVYFRIEFDHLTQSSVERQKQFEALASGNGKVNIFIDAKVDKSVIVDVGSRQDLNPKTTARLDPFQTADGVRKNRLMITNTGNVVVWLTELKQCDRSDRCAGSAWFKMIYPNERYYVVLSEDTVRVIYTERLGSIKTPRSVPISSKLS